MARPKKKDRTEVKKKILTLKLTKQDHDRLAKLVEARAIEIEEATGQRIDLTASGYLRWLMDQDALARGLVVPGAKKLEPDD